MAKHSTDVRFVSDTEIRRKIRNYFQEVEAREEVPMKKSRSSARSSARSSIVPKINEEKQATPSQKENRTPRRKPRRTLREGAAVEKPSPGETPKETTPRERSRVRVLREKKPIIHVQKLLEIENEDEDSESNDESVADNEASGTESSDPEVKFKTPVEVIQGKKALLPARDETEAKEDSCTAASSSSCETKISKLKEMAEAYFAVHHNKTIVTSDRTLSRLQNPRMSPKELQDHLSDATGCHRTECNRLFKKYVTLFPKWIFQLRHGFNILLHGLGSKRSLLEEFRKKMLPNAVHIVINGFFPSLTVKNILNMITEDLLNYSGSFKNIIDQCNFIRSEYDSADVEQCLKVHNVNLILSSDCKKITRTRFPHRYDEEADELFLLIHNIDGPILRNSKVQNALSYLASSSKIHILATIDHINAAVIWDQSRSSRFNWLWYDTTTFERYTEETSFENSLLVQQTGSLALTSLTHVLRSLTPNARGIFKLLVEFQLENITDSNYSGISFADLYQKCREKFLVNSDLTLRAQLTEFRDHKLIKFKKGADGVEHLSIPLNSSALKQFLEDNEL